MNAQPQGNQRHSDNVQRALASRHAVLHVMGPRGGESAESIIRRKMEDFTVRGSAVTLWSQHSRLAKHEHIRSLCSRGEAFLYLIADRARRGRAAAPRDALDGCRMPGQQTTGKYRSAVFYNPGSRTDPTSWVLIDDKIRNPGDDCRHLDKGAGLALVLGRIELVDPPEPISMEDWADVTGSTPVPVRTSIGCHAVCAERREMRHHPDVWKKQRIIIAVAPLQPPYSVWLK
jgi:hypothetical protein